MSDSLLSLVKRKVAIPERADYKGPWERVVIPTIGLKYINMKCNLNNEIKKTYMSEYRIGKNIHCMKPYPKTN